MSCLVAFHYRSYGTFCIYSKRLHNFHGGFTHYRNYGALFLMLSKKSLEKQNSSSSLFLLRGFCDTIIEIITDL